MGKSSFRGACAAIAGLGLLLVGAGSALAGPALPSGGQVQAGSASIGAPTGSSLTISQTSSRAIIDWSSFSIGSGGTVQFNNGAGATLNRVTGASASSIDGLLSATGSVYLLNPNGVIIGKDGVVDTGGTFAASTLDIANASFMAGGDLTFSGSSPAQVINYGKIGSLGGDVALIAAHVENDGQISAANGDVGLAAGYQVLLRDQLLDDGKFAVLIGGADTSATNTGTIQAAEAELRANGGNVYALAGNTGSIIKADGVSSNDGKVFLIAEGGAATAQGEIDAATSSGAGGQVETSGTTVDFTGLTVRAANWLVDPFDLIVDAASAATIDANLATTSVTLQTVSVFEPKGPGVVNTNGVGDIDIEAPISWGSANTLTLDASHSINITAPITVSGAGKVVLKTDDGGTGGDYGFGLGANGFAGSLSFTGTTNTGQALTINGQAYTLLYKLTDSIAATGNGPDSGTDDIAGIDHAGDSGFYALAVNLAGTGNAGSPQFSSALAGVGSKTFTGVFEGLGHTVTGLTIKDTTNGDAGLFGQSGGEIRDIGLVGGSVAGGSFFDVGQLAGIIQDTSGSAGVSNAFATGAVNDSGGNAGGLIGLNDGGAIADAYATGAVTGGSNVGGLVGLSEANSGGLGGFKPSITSSFATGAIIGYGGSVDNAGGLVGKNTGAVSNAHATGAVTGQGAIGGLIGLNTGSTGTAAISNAFAVGAVAGQEESQVGGLVGADESFGGTASITNAYATGSVVGGEFSGVGGLVGLVESQGGTASIIDAYATGAAAAGQVGGGFNDGVVGGLIGQGQVTSGAITVSNVFATGQVTVGAGAIGGGLIGMFESDGSGAITPNPGATATLTDAYATGAVIGSLLKDGNGDGAVVGGLIGAYSAYGSAASISDTYATGAVSGGAFATKAGLIAQISTGSGGTAAVSYSYWDTLTTGQTSDAAQAASFSGAGSVNGYNPATGSIGMTTSQLQGALPSGFSTGVWGTAPGIYPYLTAFFPNGVQVITGRAFNSDASAAVNALVDVYTGGVQLAGGPQTTTAGGSYYVLAPFGSLNASMQIGASIVLSGATTVSGLTYTDQPGLVSGDLANFNVTSGQVSETTGEPTYSALAVDLATSFGLAYPSIAASTAGLPLGIRATDATGFTVDQSLALGGLAVDSTQGIAITSPITISGAGQVVLTTNDGGTGGALAFALTSAGFTGSLSFTGAPHSGQALTINNQAYTLLYSMADVIGVASGLGGHYALAASIDATGTTYTNAVIPGGFSGGFNGLGNAILNLSINAPSVVPVGLFADVTSTGSVASLGLTNASITGGSYLGAVAGYNSGTLSNDGANGSVNSNGGSYVGGLVGYNEGTITNSGAANTVNSTSAGFSTGGLVGINAGTGNINDSRASSTVTGGSWTGGLVGGNLGTITDVAATGAVTGTIVTGGLAGYNGASITTASAGPGTVTASQYVGGLVGFNDTPGIITATSTSLATVSASGGSFVGGLVGYNYGWILGATASDTVNGGSTGFEIGGLVGVNASSGEIQLGSASGAVTGGSWVGGLVGGNYGAVSGFQQQDASASGPVSGSTIVGGLVGYNGKTLSFVSAGTGTVTGSQYVGGLVGYNDTTGAISGSTSGATVSAVGGSFVGGLVGYNYGSITSSNAADTVATGSSGFAVGGLVGLNASSGTVSGVANGSVTGGSWVGGLVGGNLGTMGGSAGGAVSGSIIVGGLAGYNGGTFETASNVTGSGSGSVTGGTYVGGFVGYNDTDGSISAVDDFATGGTVTAIGGAYVGGLVGYNLGAISGLAGGELVGVEAGETVNTGTTGFAVGGLVGYNAASGTIIDAEATGSVTNTNTTASVTGGGWVGGLVGANYGTVTGSSSSKITVNGSVVAGGLVGYNDGAISLSFSSSTVSAGVQALGGLVGYNDTGGTITNTYADGSVGSGSDLGGLVGINAGAINTSWASGAVASNGPSGGVAGLNDSGGVLTSVYWDEGTTGQLSALGSGSLGSSTNVTGIGGATGRGAFSQSTYVGFNFGSGGPIPPAVWNINSGTSRPYLDGVQPSSQTPPQ